MVRQFRQRGARVALVSVCCLPLVGVGIAGASGTDADGAGGAAGAANGPGAGPAGVTDHVRLGDPESESAHGLVAEGASEAATGTVEQGQLTEDYSARTVAGDGRFDVEMDVHPGQPLTLQFREVRPNDAWGAELGFEVYLDDTLVYARDSAADAGGGVYQSFFVDTSDREIFRDGSVTVTVVGSGDEPVYIGDIYAYANLDRMVDRAEMRVPDLISFVLGQDYRPDAYLRQRLDHIKENFSETEQVKLGIAFLDYFPVRSSEQMAANYARYSAYSREYDLPFAIESTSDWEGTPRGVRDGKGGFFADLEYQQVLWSPEDQTGPDQDIFTNPAGEVQRLDEFLGDAYEPRFGLSVPNVWGNTPWLTWHHPDLNAFYKDKANDSMDEVRSLVWDLQRTGELDRVLPFSTATESVYWAKRDNVGVWDIVYTDYNGGVEREDLYADLNPYTVAAAAEDGVELDPIDGGWSEEAKAWLYKNQSHHQQFFADIFYAGLPRERIEATGDQLTYPSDMLRHNVHSEIYSRKQEPYWDDIYPSSAQGVVERARPGAQFISLDDVYSLGGFYHLQKLREFGRIANPNLEVSVSPHGPDKTLLLRQAYVNGSRYTSPYNWYTNGTPESTAWIAEFIADMNPWDVVHDVEPDGQVSGESSVSQSFTADELRLANRVDVQVRRTETAPESLRLILREGEGVDGRVVSMRHLSASEAVGDDDGWVSFYLPVEQLDRGETYTIVIEQTDGATPAYEFPTADGDLLHRVGLDMDYERDRSLVITWRRDAADAIKHVAAEVTEADAAAAATLDAARAALDGHRYVEAYELAMKADAQRFPVLFQVTGGVAELDPFGLTLEAEMDLDVDVAAFAAGEELDFAVRGYEAGEVEVTIQGFADPTVLVDGEPVPVTGDGSTAGFTVELADSTIHQVRIES